MTENKIFQEKISARTKDAEKDRDERSEKANHDGQLYQNEAQSDTAIALIPEADGVLANHRSF